MGNTVAGAEIEQKLAKFVGVEVEVEVGVGSGLSQLTCLRTPRKCLSYGILGVVRLVENFLLHRRFH